MSHLFSDIVDAIGVTFHHLSNISYGALLLVAIAIVVFGVLLLRR